MYGLYRQAIEQLKDWGISEACLNRGMERAKDNFLYRFRQGNLDPVANASMCLAAALLECGRCQTERSPTAGYWGNFFLGLTNALLAQVDVVSTDVELGRLLQDPKTWEAVAELVKVWYRCHRNLPTSLQQVAQASDELARLEAVLKPLLECNLGIEYGKARQAALLLYGYVRANYQDGYLHGQVAGFVLTLPILVERLPALAQYLKADRLFALLGKNNKLADSGERLRQLLKSAKGGHDNLTRSLKQLQKEHPEQFADEFVEHWDDSRRNAPGSGEPVANSLPPPKDGFFTSVDDFAETFDRGKTLSAALRQEAFDLYKQHDWKKLEKLFKDNKINFDSRINDVWPPANGGYNIVDDVPLLKGMKFDRYGGAINGWDGKRVPPLGGNFTSPITNGSTYSFGQRALNQAETAYDFYYEIEILKDLPFKGQTADVIPWFGQPGGGKQTMWRVPKNPNSPQGFTFTLTELAEMGLIKITIKGSPSSKYLDFVNVVIQRN